MSAAAALVARRRRWWVVAAWLLLTALLAPAAGRVERELDVAAQVHGSEAAAVERALAERFHSPFARFAVLVVSGVPAPSGASGRDVLRRVVDAVERVPGVSGTLSYLTAPDTLFVGAGGTGTFLIVGLDPAGGRPDALIPPLRAATAALAADLRGAHPTAALRWTGELAINVDIRRASAEESRAAEQRVLPLTMALLLAAFGAVVAALLPLLAAGVAIVLALGLAALLNEVWPLSVLLQNVVSMIGLGVGIDYALLTVSRFREARARAGGDDTLAAAETARHAGSTIALSGAAVAIGFAALLLVPLNELQSIAVGGLLVVSLAVLVSMTLLPALLAALGPRVDALRVRRSRRPDSEASPRWLAWGRWVTAHPWLVLLVAGAPVGLLALEARRLHPELPRGNWLPRQMESSLALEDLAAMRRSGVVSTLRVLLELPPDTTVLHASGWAAARRIVATIEADPRVARVNAVTTVLPTARPNAMLYSALPAPVRRSLVTDDGRTLLLEAFPRDGVEFTALSDLTRDLRRLNAAAVSGLPGVRLRVGGMPAFNADYDDAIASRLPHVVALVVLATFVALMVGFRSVLVPLKALALNLLSVAAAMGAVVLVFQDGLGAGLLGLDGPMHGVFPAVPILVFCIVFGLSMDYEVFLVARVAEARRHLPEREAIAEGLARTGGVITSAAAIMIVVFAAFTLGDFLFIKVLGFALAVAVLLDATVVRVAVGPALLALAGRWNWWPGRTMTSEARAGSGAARPAVGRLAGPSTSAAHERGGTGD